MDVEGCSSIAEYLAAQKGAVPWLQKTDIGQEGTMGLMAHVNPLKGGKDASPFLGPPGGLDLGVEVSDQHPLPIPFNAGFPRPCLLPCNKDP